MTNTD